MKKSWIVAGLVMVVAVGIIVFTTCKGVGPVI